MSKRKPSLKSQQKDDFDSDSSSSSDDIEVISDDRVIEINNQSHVMSQASPNLTCDCMLDLLRYKPFSSHSLEDQVNIVNKGRPTPDLVLTREKKGRGVIKFQPSWYKKNPWLCGCRKTQKLYCWPCVLFGTSKNSSWRNVDQGISDLPNFSVLRQRHTILKEHVSSLVQLERFGKQSPPALVRKDDPFKTETINAIVQSNRYVFTRMVDMVVFMRTQETDNIMTDGKPLVTLENYMDHLHTTAKVDPVLKHHLNQSTFVTDPPPNIDITDKMIQAVTKVSHEAIKSELSNCNYVSVIVMTLPVDSSISHVFTAVRYVTNYEARERFIKFEEANSDRTIATYLSALTKTLNEFDCQGRVVCHTFDGATVKTGNHNSLQRFVRTKYPSAVFIPSHTHHLCWVLQQSVRSAMQECDVFFEICSQVMSFFSEPAHCAVFDSIMGRGARGPGVPLWQFVTLLSDSRSKVTGLLCEMATNILEWKEETRKEATSLLYALKRKKFKFIMGLFSQLLPKAEVLFTEVQKSLDDKPLCEKLANEFNTAMTELGHSVTEEWEEDVSGFAPPCKSPRLDLLECTGSPLTSKNKTPRVLASDILVHVKAVVRERYSNLSDCRFLTLLNTAKFTQHARVFPNAAFAALEDTFEKCFEFLCLRQQLRVVYNDAECLNKSIYELYAYLRDSNLQATLAQVYKLAELFLSLPLTRCESSLNQNFTQVDSHPRPSLTQLAFLSIERQSLNESSRSTLFYDQVIEKFREQTDYLIPLKYK